MLTSLDFVIDPVLEALIVDVLHAAQAFTQTDQWILSAVGAIEAKAALFIGTEIALPRYTLYIS